MNLSKIKEDFNKVIAFSQGIPDPKTDRLFDTWLQSKERFIEAFGGQYIYEWPEKIYFELGEKEKHKRVIDFIDLVANMWGYENLADFIEAQEDGFFKNLTIEDYELNGKIIRKGTKLVRAFKYFVPEGRGLTDIQNEASRIIQEDRIGGRLCISVHPLDYLSSSETTYNWRSCHSLDGEYRAGNLSYMTDRSTLVCYLKADEDDTVLPGFGPEVKWNSKKWRVLIHMSEDWNMVFSGRQYPFESAVGMDFVLYKLLHNAGLCVNSGSEYWTGWSANMISQFELAEGIIMPFRSPHMLVGEELMPLNCLVTEGQGSKQFCDVLYSSCYKPMYSVKCFKSFWQNYSPCTNTTTTKFILGGYTYCLWCGEKECLSGADTMLCEKCELEYGSSDNEMFTFCDCCGRRMYSDDAYIVGDEEICYECFCTQCSICAECGETVWNEDIHYNEATDQYLCTWCLQE